MYLIMVICVILPVIGLGYYVIHKVTPGMFLVRTSLARVLSFQMEIQSDKAEPRPVSALPQKTTQS